MKPKTLTLRQAGRLGGLKAAQRMTKEQLVARAKKAVAARVAKKAKQKEA